MPDKFQEKVVIVSGPSGVGKTSVVEEVLRRAPVPLVCSVSATTRSPRPGEINGKNYHFLTDDDFQLRRRRGEFLEYYAVFNKGYWYGTLLSELVAGFKTKKWVILNIDVHGAVTVMERYADAISIFIHPSSLKELEHRLRGRGTETEDAIQSRLAKAQEELAFAPRYRYNVINDSLEQAVKDVCSILIKEWENVQND